MFRERYAELRFLSWLGDLFAIGLAYYLALFLRDSILVGVQLPLVGVLDQVEGADGRWFLHWALLLGALLLRSCGVYHDLRAASAWRMVVGYVRFTLLLGVLLSALAYMGHAFELSRALVAFFLTLLVLLYAIKVLLVLKLLHAMRRRGLQQHNLLVVGTGPRAESCLRRLQGHPEWGVVVVGLVDKEPQRLGDEVCGTPVVGTFADVESLLDRHPIDEVVFMGPRSWLVDLEPVVLACEEVGVRFHHAIDLFTTAIARPSTASCAGLRMISYETRPGPDWAIVLKRVADVALSSTLILLLSPLFVVVALLIGISSPGPIFFVQRRVGLYGRTFHMLKFRTMELYAEERRGDLDALNELDGPVFKIQDDPRVFPLGRYLRRFSIDELPQLVNVLFGQMSLVGPRPPLAAEVADYSRWQLRRLSMRPGMTGLWQVSGRNQLGFSDWMKLDLRYIDEWSLGLDFRLLALTLPAVVTGRGAY